MSDQFADPDLEETPEATQTPAQPAQAAPKKKKNKKNKNKNKSKSSDSDANVADFSTNNDNSQSNELQQVSSKVSEIQVQKDEALDALQEQENLLAAQAKKKKELEDQIKILKSKLDDKFVDILEKSEIKPEDVAEQPYADEGLSFNRSVTVRAPMNIAFVKYWGKRDVNLNLPLTSSLSATLSPDVMFSETTVETSRFLKRDEISINDDEFQEIPADGRTKAVLQELRWLARREHGKVKLTKKQQNEKEGKKTEIKVNEDALPASFFSQKLRIKSKNNFPTAAGLASSASGYAALTYAVAHLYSLNPYIAQSEVTKKLTAIARQGSGSACRSMYGGFVEWQKGEEKDGRDSIATQLAPSEHWPELRFLICVSQQDQKKVSSTTGMIRSQRTSTLLEHRSNKVCDQIMGLVRNSIMKRNFAMLSELIMRDSNQFHAICMDTFPPIEYLNATSRKIMDMVHRYNGQTAKKCLAYTFDAGPNAVLVTTQDHIHQVASLVMRYFKAEDTTERDFFHKIQDSLPVYPEKIKEEERIVLENFEGEPGGIEYCIHTMMGNGPKILQDAFEVVDTRKAGFLPGKN